MQAGIVDQRLKGLVNGIRTFRRFAGCHMARVALAVIGRNIVNGISGRLTNNTIFIDNAHRHSNTAHITRTIVNFVFS